MNVASLGPDARAMLQLQEPLPKPPVAAEDKDGEIREQFQAFVGQTLFGQMLKSMRKTLGKPAYFHGGRTEEIFQQQLDQVLAKKISDASSEQFTEPMFELFMMDRQK